MNALVLMLKRYSKFSDRVYVLLRWIMCPFERMEKYIPKKGMVVDVGCGEGIFSIYLAMISSKRKVIGIDIESRRLSLAKRSSSDLENIEFKNISATQLTDKCQGIIISDSFHHFGKEDQLTFLKICSKILTKNGILVIKEINKSDFVRSRLSRLWDFILYPHDSIRYWSKQDLELHLKSLGFSIKTKNEARYFPGSTLLYICTKK